MTGDRLRETWVDLDNRRCTRDPEILEAWRDRGLDLVSTSEPVDVDPRMPDNDVWVACTDPISLSDGVPSMWDHIVSIAQDHHREAQMAAFFENQASADQLTLMGAVDA